METSTITDSVGHETGITPAFTELVQFLVAENPERFADFQTGEKVRERVWELVRREKNDTITSQEKAELDTYGHLEHVLRLAKTQARINIALRDATPPQ